jgi:polyribonucleotide 5'-hydroxyl-kinase
MKAFRAAQIRSYFFGNREITLNPHTHWEAFSDLHIYRLNEAYLAQSSATTSTTASLAYDADDDYEPSSDIMTSYGGASSTSTPMYVRINPSSSIQYSLIAVTTAEPSDIPENIRDASLMGYLYLADVDDAKQRCRLLAPIGGRLPSRAFVVGKWPEEVLDLVG